MYTVITSEKKIQKLQDRLFEHFKKQANEIRFPVLGYQGNSWKEKVFYSEKFDVWFCSSRSENRFWNAFGLGEPKDEVQTNIICEINFPYEGINRNIAGVFAEDEFGNEVILHRGKIGGGRKGIGKSLFREQYRGKYVQAIDGDMDSEFALIGDVNSEKLIQQVALFVREVFRIKEGGEALVAPEFTFNEEFFGKKKISARAETEANCNHGTIVNALASVLEEKGFKIGKDKNRDLFTHASGKIRNIFEIKPDYGPSSLYSAIGQLVVYSIDTNAKLYIVIPRGLNGKIIRKMSEVGIDIIEFDWKKEEPIFYELEKVGK